MQKLSKCWVQPTVAVKRKQNPIHHTRIASRNEKRKLIGIDWNFHFFFSGGGEVSLFRGLRWTLI